MNKNKKIFENFTGILNLFKTNNTIENNTNENEILKMDQDSIELIVKEYKPKIAKIEKYCYHTSKLSGLLKTIDVSELENIHKDKKVAIELVKWFISMFPTSYTIDIYKNTKGEKISRRKMLYHYYLVLTFGKLIYSKIKSFCINHNIIEVVRNYSKDLNLSTIYQLTDEYFYSKDVCYTFKTKPVIKKYIAKELNQIRKNLSSGELTELYIQELKNRFYENIHIPCIEEVKSKLEYYAKNKKKDNNDCLVITLKKYYEIINTKSNISKEEKILRYAKNNGAEKVVIVEHMIEHFKRTKDKLPMISKQDCKIYTNVNEQTNLILEMIK